MSDMTDPPRSSLGESLRDDAAEARHRELAVEHLLFQALAFMEDKHPGLLDHLDASISNLGDSASDETKDDEAVRDVARLFVQSLRKNA